MITHEDVMELKRVFDDRYVKQDYCDEQQHKINSKFANDNKEIAIINHDFSILKKMGWIIATAVVTQTIATILGVITRFI